MCFAAELSPDVEPGTFVDPGPRRAEIARTVNGARRPHFQDLVIATGRLTNEAGDVIVCRELGLGVTRTPADGFREPWYKVILFGPSGARDEGWRCVLSFVFHGEGGKRGVEILRYVPGDWERRLLAWGLAADAADARERAEVVHRSDIDLLDPEPEDPAELVTSRILPVEDRQALRHEAGKVLAAARELTAREIAALLVLRADFDASLEAHLADGHGYASHPDYRTYVAMRLQHEEAVTVSLGSDDELVESLIRRHGQQGGLARGELRWLAGEGGEGGVWRQATWADRHVEYPPYGTSRFLRALGID